MPRALYVTGLPGILGFPSAIVLSFPEGARPWIARLMGLCLIALSSFLFVWLSGPSSGSGYDAERYFDEESFVADGETPPEPSDPSIAPVTAAPQPAIDPFNAPTPPPILAAPSPVAVALAEVAPPSGPPSANTVRAIDLLIADAGKAWERKQYRLARANALPWQLGQGSSQDPEGRGDDRGGGGSRRQAPPGRLTTRSRVDITEGGASR